MNAYLAAPFFSAEEIAVCKSIERTVQPFKQTNLFSPRIEAEHLQGQIHERTVRMQIFQENLLAIEDSAVIFAWIDRIPQDGASLCVAHPDRAELIPVQIPDTGTVFEIGYAKALGKQIHFLTTRSGPPKGVNLMLSEAASIVHTGEYDNGKWQWPSLYAFLDALDTWGETFKNWVDQIRSEE
jgi:nucleoside 2-deoxyribosyltransferase